MTLLKITKYGHVTQVWINREKVIDMAVTPVAAKRYMLAIFKALGITDWMIEEDTE